MSQLERISSMETDNPLHTKLAPPRLHTPLVAREALLDRLDDGLDRKLTLLSAPAGFGKTTLVSQWLARLNIENVELRNGAETQHSQFSILNSSFKVAWVALDAGDNDPVRFWRYVLTACQGFAADVGAAALAQLHAPQPPNFELLLTLLINDLAALPRANLPSNILALEDYHLITMAQLHATMTFFVDQLPPTLHLVITTRRDPPLPLARLRARLEINELTAADLRFSASETQAFLEQTLAVPLAPQAIARLDARTEGWVTGLRLATLALHHHQSPSEVERFLDTFAGNHRHILAYLLDEVLTVQSKAIQDFLLHTTFLDRLTAALCDAVMGRDDSALLLEELERANLFLIPLDGHGSWYRYHTLFAEAMQHLAQQRLDAEQRRALSERASLWYTEQGLLPEAVELALAAAAFERVAELIARSIEPRLVNNEYTTLRRWLSQLPQAVLRRHPALCFTYALAIQFTSDRRAPEIMALLEPPLRLAEEEWRAQGDQRQLGAVQALRAMAAWWQGDVALAFHSAHAALASLPEDEMQWRSISLLFIASEQLLAGQLNAAQQTILVARGVCEKVGNIYGLLSATNVLADVRVGQGELHQAAGLYHQARALIEVHRLQTDQAHFEQARALIGLAAISLAWNDLDAAACAAEEARDLGQHIDEEFIYAPATLIWAEVLHSRGQAADAQALLHTLSAQLPQRRWPFLLRAVALQQARLALHGGQVAAVQRWSMSLTPLADLPVQQQEAEALLCARLHLAQAEPEAALYLLSQWQRDAQAGGRTRSQVEMYLLRALAYFSQEKLTEAKATLRTALTLARPYGEQGLFVHEGTSQAYRPPGALAALLRALLVEVKEVPLLSSLRTLLLAVAKAPTTAGEASTPPPGLLLEPLSPQEERVLRLLAAGLTNPEIARELIVSVNTVKTQVQSIFRKLQVNNRQEARDAARHLNLR
jgi:LuxR family transcriptional regulator, maltose regulon positive regulatory protein